MENLQKKQKTYERHDVEGTPFSIMEEVTTNSCRITIGNNLMTNTIFNSKEATIKYIKSKPWELILNTLTLMCINTFNELLTSKSQQND